MIHPQNERIFQGIWPALFTPTRPDGQVQPQELEKLINLCITQQLDGLYLLGSTGQGFLFDEKQRMAITEATLEIADKRLPVMVQVGALNTEESVRLAKHAVRLGAAGISAVGPMYYGASVEMAFQHYRRIAQATDAPFFPYQIGTAADAELIQRLQTVEQIQGMKLTTTKLLEISSIYNTTRPDWQLFSGADELMCHAALCGTVGAIGTTYNLLGSTCQYIRASFLAGEVEQARAFMLHFQAFIEKILPYVWAFFRRAMQLRHNIDIGQPKPPLLAPALPWTDAEMLNMVEELERFNPQPVS